MQINDEGLKVLAKMKQLSALNISSYKSADPETQALINLYLSSKNLSRQFFQPSPKSKKEALHRAPNKPTDVKRLGNLTQLTMLGLGGNQLTELPIGLGKLTQLKMLVLHSAPKPLNPDMPPWVWVRRRALPSYPTKAQIDQLQKALPNCTIRYHATK